MDKGGFGVTDNIHTVYKRIDITMTLDLDGYGKTKPYGQYDVYDYLYGAGEGSTSFYSFVDSAVFSFRTDLSDVDYDQFTLTINYTLVPIDGATDADGNEVKAVTSSYDVSIIKDSSGLKVTSVTAKQSA